MSRKPNLIHDIFDHLSSILDLLLIASDANSPLSRSISLGWTWLYQLESKEYEML